MTLDPHVYDLAARRLSDRAYPTSSDREAAEHALATRIQEAIEEWEEARDLAMDPRRV